MNELNSVLANTGFQNPYLAPAGYFDGLADEILKRIKALEATTATEELESLSPLLSTISKKMPHTVPAGYFDTLAKKMELPHSSDELTPQEELESLSPLLSGLKNKTTYTLPAGYFENLQPAIASAKAGSTAKVVPITHRTWFRYAAAAIVIGVVATIGFLGLGKNDTLDPESKSYAWVQKNLKKVSTEDINKFVELTVTGSTEIAKVDAIEITSLLKDVSDKEIQDFLNDTQLAESESDDIILN